MPSHENTATHGDKRHQVFHKAKSDLDNILSGYILPEPYFRERLRITVEKMMKCLKDPALPLLELQVSRDFLGVIWNILGLSMMDILGILIWDMFGFNIGYV